LVTFFDKNRTEPKMITPTPNWLNLTDLINFYCWFNWLTSWLGFPEFLFVCLQLCKLSNHNKNL
jgi:hypothetical protein